MQLLLNLKTKASSGPDDIPKVFQRRYAISVAKCLVIIFHSALPTSQLSSDWKTARIVPLFKKKGDRLTLGNYRPISLTSSCKIFEHIATSINKFLEEHSILTKFQHGFRKGFSTVTKLVTLFHSLALTLYRHGMLICFSWIW